MHFLAFSVFKLLCGLNNSESVNRNDPLHILLLNQLSLIFDKSVHRSFILPVFRNLNDTQKIDVQHTAYNDLYWRNRSLRFSFLSR